MTATSQYRRASEGGGNRRALFAIVGTALLTDTPAGVFQPTEALAQSSPVAAGPPGIRAKKAPPRPKPQKAAGATETRASDTHPAAVPTLHDLAGRFGDHIRSVGWELAAVGGALTAIGVLDWDWGGSKFEFIEEGWFGSNTRHGGMDKIGHAFSTFVIADILTDRIRANASEPGGAPITGALLGFGIMGAGEAIDGFTGKHRFSREDIVANAAGAVFSIVRNSVPGLSEKLDFRLLYTPASDERPGIKSSEFHFLPPYERQRYLLALKGSGFDALKTTPLRYVELQGGFEARGFEDNERRLGYPKERTLYAGIGLNLNEVLFGAGSFPNFAKYRDTVPGWAVRKTFEYLQVPYTAAYYGNTFSTVRAAPRQ